MNLTTNVDEGHEKTVLLSPYQDDLLESAKRAWRTIVDINQPRGPQKAPGADAILRDLRRQILFCRQNCSRGNRNFDELAARLAESYSEEDKLDQKLGHIVKVFCCRYP